MYYTIELTFIARRPLTVDALFDVAEIGATCGNPGRRRLETTLTVWARSLPVAAERGIAKVTRRVAGKAIAVNAMTLREADRRLKVLKP